jgi:hypothetical protein
MNGSEITSAHFWGFAVTLITTAVIGAGLAGYAVRQFMRLSRAGNLLVRMDQLEATLGTVSQLAQDALDESHKRYHREAAAEQRAAKKPKPPSPSELGLTMPEPQGMVDGDGDGGGGVPPVKAPGEDIKARLRRLAFGGRR